MSKTHRISWAAGFFDGEGYVTVQERGGKYKGYYLRIGVNHVLPEPLEEMQNLFGGNIRKQNPQKIIGNRKQRHEWGLSCKKAESALRQMLPFMKNKQNVTKLALDLQNSMGTTQKVPEEIRELRRDIKTEIQRLNALG